MKTQYSDVSIEENSFNVWYTRAHTYIEKRMNEER